MWTKTRGPSANLIIAVGQPLLVVGLIAGGRHANSYGSESLGLLLIVVGSLVWVLSLALGAPILPTFLSALALAVALIATWVSVDTSVMYARGVRTDCTVVDVVERTETQIYSDGPSITTYYDHRLRCQAGGVEVLSLGSPVADKGQQLEVAYDPAGRMAPVPASVLTDGREAAWIAAGTTGLALILRVGGVLWERRHRPA